MKRLDRKGFTLVELLAVIVILAIVVGISLVTIIPTLENSRKKSFDVAVETVKQYIVRQHELSVLSSEFQGDEYNSAVGTANSGSGTTGSLLQKTGYTGKISAIQWTYSSGIVTVTCATADPAGDYAQSTTYTACS